MATAEQISAFNSQWSPFAATAGSALGVAPSTILGQWALESGYGTNSLSRGYNVGSIMPGGVGASYASPGDFATAYTNLLSRNYPAALNTGSDVSAFVTGLQRGNHGSYFGNDNPSQYAASIASIAGNTGALAGTGGTVVGSASSGDSTVAGRVLDSVGNWAGTWASRASLLLIGTVLLLGAMWLFAKRSETVKAT